MDHTKIPIICNNGALIINTGGPGVSKSQSRNESSAVPFYPPATIKHKQAPKRQNKSESAVESTAKSPCLDSGVDTKQVSLHKQNAKSVIETQTGVSTGLQIQTKVEDQNLQQHPQLSSFKTTAPGSTARSQPHPIPHNPSLEDSSSISDSGLDHRGMPIIGSNGAPIINMGDPGVSEKSGPTMKRPQSRSPHIPGSKSRSNKSHMLENEELIRILCDADNEKVQNRLKSLQDKIKPSSQLGRATVFVKQLLQQRESSSRVHAELVKIEKLHLDVARLRGVVEATGIYCRNDEELDWSQKISTTQREIENLDEGIRKTNISGVDSQLRQLRESRRRLDKEWKEVVKKCDTQAEVRKKLDDMHKTEKNLYSRMGSYTDTIWNVASIFMNNDPSQIEAAESQLNALKSEMEKNKFDVSLNKLKENISSVTVSELSHLCIQFQLEDLEKTKEKLGKRLEDIEQMKTKLSSASSTTHDCALAVDLLNDHPTSSTTHDRGLAVEILSDPPTSSTTHDRGLTVEFVKDHLDVSAQTESQFVSAAATAIISDNVYIHCSQLEKYTTEILNVFLSLVNFDNWDTLGASLSHLNKVKEDMEAYKLPDPLTLTTCDASLNKTEHIYSSFITNVVSKLRAFIDDIQRQMKVKRIYLVEYELQTKINKYEKKIMQINSKIGENKSILSDCEKTIKIIQTRSISQRGNTIENVQRELKEVKLRLNFVKLDDLSSEFVKLGDRVKMDKFHEDLSRLEVQLREVRVSESEDCDVVWVLRTRRNNLDQSISEIGSRINNLKEQLENIEMELLNNKFESISQKLEKSNSGRQTTNNDNPRVLSIIGEPRGFVNPSEYCFLNCVLQILRTCVNFTEDVFQFHTNRLEKKSGGISGDLGQLFIDLRNNEKIDAEKSLSTVQRQFRNKGGDDIHKCFMNLLSTLNSEIAQPRSIRCFERLEQIWEKHRSRNDGIIFDNFYGMKAYQTKCKLCNAILFENGQLFKSMPLAIPAGISTTLEICIQQNVEDADIEMDEPMSCECERGDTMLTKSCCQIYRSPRYLFVYLNRGSFQDHGVKNETMVDHDHNKPLTIKTMEGAVQYKLIATIDHLGDNNYGHYLCKCSYETDQWWSFNDARCTKLDTEDIVTKNTNGFVFKHISGYLT